MDIGQIDQDLKQALLGGDRLRVEVLRGLKAALVNEAIKQRQKPETVDIIKVAQKEIKKRDQAIELYARAGRPELADKETQERNILSQYLPAQLSQAELGDLVEQAIKATNASSLKDMGLVMQYLQSNTDSASVDRSALALLVKQKLA